MSDESIVERVGRASVIIRQSERLAFACGLLPVPAIDMAAVATIQLRMIRQLATCFGVDPKGGDGGPLRTAIVGALVPVSLGTTFSRSVFRHVPGLGSLLGALSMPASLAAATRIVGLLVAHHLETGGTLEDFDLRSLRSVSNTTPPGDTTVARSTTAAPQGASTAAQSADDLTKVEGIGPKIAVLLADAGIHTFAELAASPPERLQSILSQAGPHYRMHDPRPWRGQASLAARGLWGELDELQGREVPTQADAASSE